MKKFAVACIINNPRRFNKYEIKRWLPEELQLIHITEKLEEVIPRTILFFLIEVENIETINETANQLEFEIFDALETLGCSNFNREIIPEEKFNDYLF